MSKAVLITGATGQQGGSVIKALIQEDADFEILAVTRNTTSARAQNLQQMSSKIKLVQGDLDEPQTIFQNVQRVTSQPIWGIFSVQLPSFASREQNREEKQGKALIDEALKNNVKLFIYTSVDRGGDASFDTPTRVPHFISKHNIEHHLVERAQNTEMNWTILRPVAFSSNFSPNFFGKLFITSWKVGLKDRPLQLISPSDIGFFGAQAFINPEQYKDQSLSLAGMDITFDEMAAIFKAKMGKEPPLTFEFLARLMFWMVKDFRSMFQFFYESGYQANIPAMKKLNLGLKDFGSWLETESGFLPK